MSCLLRQREIYASTLVHHSVDVGGEEPLEQLPRASAAIYKSFEGRDANIEYVFHAAILRSAPVDGTVAARAI
ncbi:hypothetical protein O9993_15855 [Vibrio lentus]|nr:hypothetical protein [Vibrio lentus]